MNTQRLLLWVAALCTTNAAAAQPAPPSPQRAFDHAFELLMGGYTERAQEAFEVLTDTPQFAIAAVVAMADCQLTLGAHRAALQTLQRVPATERGADWFRAAATAERQAGRYVNAIEHGSRAIELDPEHVRARYELGQLQEMLGRLNDAVQTYAWFNDLLTGTEFPKSPVTLHYAGMGFYRYSVLTRVPNLSERTEYVLQDVLQPACMIIDVGYWPARLAIANMLREKYKPEDATEDYRAVLARNPNAIDAHLGLGRVALQNWAFERVEMQVDVCLDINPRSVEALVLLAELRMLERRFEDAIVVSEQALALNPNHIEALALLAAGQLRTGRDQEAESTQQRVRNINPTPAVMHAIIGKQLSDGRQFPASESHLLKAIEFDPTNPAPRNELAMMYMQWGLEDRAREVADAAFELDQYNDRTKHTLDLLDILDGFGRHESEHFEIHFDRENDAVLGDYMAEYLESIYAELTEDYDIDLQDKTLIEVFPDPRQFGVRISGKPWIHTIGACTGRVIAMSAPRDGVAGHYHYASVLRHEFTHTVTLAATANRIPHWFTEGLAVLQEDRPRSWSWTTMLAERLRRGELFSVAKIDWGFIRPRRPDDRQVAYAQSEWMCEFLIDRFGYDIINEMLSRYREGQVQPEVLKALTDMNAAEFDVAFQAWARSEALVWGLPLDAPPEPRWVRWLLEAYPNSPDLLAAHATILREQGEIDAAWQAAQAAVEVAPENPRALLALARCELEVARAAPTREMSRSHADSAKQLYETLVEVDPDQADAVVFLAEWAREHDDPEAAERWAERLKALQPGNPISYRILSGLALLRNDDTRAMAELLQLALQDDHDADLARQLARIYRTRGQLQEAAYWFSEAVHIDAFDLSTHRLYAETLTELGRHEEAIRECRMLTRLAPDDARNHADLAFAYFRAGRRDAAVQAARVAVDLDASSPAKQLLGD